MAWSNSSSKTPVFLASDGGIPARTPGLTAIALSASLLSFAASAQDVPATVVPERAQPIRTAPSAKPNVLSGADVEALSRAAARGPKSASAAVGAEHDVPWVLSPEQQPWPLHYREPPPLNVLHLNIPSLEEARLMLPGRSADMLERAQASIHKYINDAIGQAAQFRGAQLEALDVWIERTLNQLREVPQHPWAQYQFNKTARKALQDYRAHAEHQGGRGLTRVYDDIQQAVTRISPILDVMPTHELSLGWYNAMVQLRNGLELYQSQVSQADSRVLAKIDDFLTRHPPIVQPAGEPPPQPRAGLSGLEAIEKTAQTPVAPRMQMAAPAVPPDPVQQAEATASEDSTGGLIVLGGMLAALGYFTLRVRKAARRKAPNPD